MDLIELGAALSCFFEQGARSPSHDQISNAFERADVSAGDPRASSTTNVGKVKRVRQVFVHAHDCQPEAGIILAKHLVALLRATGAFKAHLSGFVGEERFLALQRSLKAFGLDLDKTGCIRPTVIDNLHGSELTAALQAHITRANLNPDDCELLVGNGKELDEAAARHVLEQVVGMYDARSNFPRTLRNAFSTLGLSAAPQETSNTLDRDPHVAVQQCLYALSCAINRLRNEVGTGHGRPSPSTTTQPLTEPEARLVARASALVAGMLLDSMAARRSQ